MAQPLDLDAYPRTHQLHWPPHTDLRRSRRHPSSPQCQHPLRKLRRSSRPTHPARPRRSASQDRHRPPRRLLLRTRKPHARRYRGDGLRPRQARPPACFFSNRAMRACASTCSSPSQSAAPPTSSTLVSAPLPPPVPIPIHGTPVPTSTPTHRLAREGNDWFLYVTRDGEQIQGWVSTMEEEYLVDFEMMNYYIATHPASFFTHNILASAVTQGGRVNIMNQGVHIIRNGAVEPMQLADRKALRAALVAQHFGFDLPELVETMRVDGVPGWQ